MVPQIMAASNYSLPAETRSRILSEIKGLVN